MSTLEQISRTRPHREYPSWIKQALKFAVVGVLNTALDAGVYLVLTRWLGFAMLPVLAKVISYGVGVLNSFYWNRSWTFRSEASALAALVPFVLSSLVATAINASVMYICLNWLNLSEILALVLATGIAFLWNFAVSKFVVFRK